MTDQNLTAAISSECECGRLKLIQSGWRWSPRRKLPRHDEFEMFFHTQAVVVGSTTETRLVSAVTPLSSILPALQFTSGIVSG